MSNNGSMAVWCRSNNKSVSTEFEAHFNYWHLAGDKSFRPNRGREATDFVEVGILLCNPHHIERIFIYIPLKVELKAIEDCSKYLSKAKIAQGIFNEVLTVSVAAPTGPRCIELRKDENILYCRVHCFTTTNGTFDPAELSTVQHEDGTRITIEPGALREACTLAKPEAPVYFRLRFFVPKVNPFIRVIPAPDRMFQSSYNEIEYIDFRVNEARTLPESVEKSMRLDRENGLVALKLVAFLTALPVKSQLSTSNTPMHKMRLLESDPWIEYVSGGIPDGMMVYHWKRGLSLKDNPPTPQPPITDFTAFVKLETRRTDRNLYLILAFIIGVVGNLLSAGILWVIEPHTARVIAPPPVASGTSSTPTSTSNAETNIRGITNSINHQRVGVPKGSGT